MSDDSRPLYVQLCESAWVRGDATYQSGRTTAFDRVSPDYAAIGGWFLANLNAGILVIFAFSGLTILGTMLAGWSSNNKFSLLGGLRAGSQMISYEVVMGLTVMGLILVFNTVDLRGMVQQQSGMIGGVLPAWGVFYQPFAAVLFLTAAIAENKRIPFDLPEAESELVAGYHTEYGWFKVLMFYIGEYGHMLVSSALVVTGMRAMPSSVRPLACRPIDANSSR